MLVFCYQVPSALSLAMTVEDLSTPFLSSITRRKGNLKSKTDGTSMKSAVLCYLHDPQGKFSLFSE